MEGSIWPYLIFWRLEFFRKISESRAMTRTREDPPTGRDKDMVAIKMCRRPLMACVWFFRSMGFAHRASTITVTRKHAKKTYPKCLAGTSHAKAFQRTHVMLWAHEIRSTSAESLACSASTKRWPNLQNGGPRMANIAAKHTVVVQLVAVLHSFVP